jgi:outer membrane receptor protein involved in Fe transport
VTPKAALSYAPDRDNLFYLSAAKGYRVGGFNVDVGSVCAPSLATLGLKNVPGQYASDSLWSYEIGAKNAFLGNRVRVSSSAFIIDWTNIQQSVILPCGLGFVTNSGRVRSEGGDIDIQALPLADLLLDVALSYVDAHFTQTVCGGATACTGPDAPSKPIVSQGDRLVGAPWTVLLAGEYTFPALQQRRPYLRVGYQLTTAQTGLLPIQNPRDGIGDPTVTGLPETHNLFLRAGLRWSGWDLSLFGQNLTDEHPVLFQFHDASFSTEYWNRGVRPRTLGLTATYRY